MRPSGAPGAIRFAGRLALVSLVLALVSCGDGEADQGSEQPAETSAMRPAAAAGSARRLRDEARRYVLAVRWAARRSDRVGDPVRIRPVRGGPRGERIAVPFSPALRRAIREASGGRPPIRFGGEPARRGELDIGLSTFGGEGDERFVRLTRFGRGGTAPVTLVVTLERAKGGWRVVRVVRG